MKKHIEILLFIGFTLSSLSGSGKHGFSALNQDTSITITKARFNDYVNSSIELLQNKNVNEISDSEHKMIIMCLNTIQFTRDSLSQKVFSGGGYEKLILTANQNNYVENLLRRFPNNIPSRGMGFYFPEINVELYGTPHSFSYFTLID